VHGSSSPESGARQIKIFFPGLVYRSGPAGDRHGATAAAPGIRIQRHQQIVALAGSFVMGSMLAFLGRDMAVDLGTANTLV